MSELEKNRCNCDAVCAEVMRVFDSCSSQDCLEDLEVTYCSDAEREIINCAKSVKSKCIEVINVSFNIDSVPFNKGFYAIDITYTFKIDLEVTMPSSSNPVLVVGYTTFTKKVILFGGDGTSKTFSSDDTTVLAEIGCCCAYVLSKASVSVVEPMCLDIKLVNPYPSCGEMEDMAKPPNPRKKLLITIGMFAIVQLKRAVPMLVPAYDYCIPKKECSTNTDGPCELFEKISFPTSEFFTKTIDECCNSEEHATE